MTASLQLTQQENPTAQTFVIGEASVLTGIGIFFASVSSTHPITLEVRPTTESGFPSATRYIPGTRVVAGPGTGISIPSENSATTNTTTFYSAPPEHKFEFDEPLYVPAGSLLSFCLYTSAPPGEYKIYTAKSLDFKYGKTTTFYTVGTATDRGSFFASSNGTSWEADNTKDVTYKIYRARFNTSDTATAVLNANTPPWKRLTETAYTDNLGSYTYDPLLFTANDATVKVRHPAHGFQAGDKVYIKSDGVGSFDSSESINGVKGSSILGLRTLTAVDPFGYTFEMDSTAANTARGGGSGLMANENYVMNQLKLSVPFVTPPNTTLTAKADLTTTKSHGGTETAYQTTQGIRVPLNQKFKLKNPHVIASEHNEDHRLSGNASSKFTISMKTVNPYVAPYINVGTALLATEEMLVGNGNTTTTVPTVAETSPDGGTTAAKHITVPYQLENTSTSIMVLIDALRPLKSEFSVWYRTHNSADETTSLADKNWVEFSKTSKQTQGRTYSEIAASDTKINEYQFDAFNLNAFDQYQLKITMDTQRQSYPPIIGNLRIIATS